MKKLNLVMPMGGAGTRFGRLGYECPKPLIDLFGKPFFYHAANSIAEHVELASITFVVLKDHVERFSINKEILRYFPDACIEVLDEVLPGAVLTCMKGVEHLNGGEPVIFNDCDHSFLCGGFYDFCKNNFEISYEKQEIVEGADELIFMDGDAYVNIVTEYVEPDGMLLTFESDEDKFSYAAFDDDGFVTKTVEKKVISNDAICGAYYFKNKEVFLKNANEYLDKCEYSEFFMSGVYNVMCDHGLKVAAMRVDEHTSFGTPDEYEAVLKTNTELY